MKHSLMPEVGLLTLFLLPSAFSFECGALNREAYATCLTVKVLPIEDKDQFYAALLHPEPYEPQHDIIYTYNGAILVKEKPAGAPFKDGKYIKNAWVKILAVMPSVWGENKTFVPTNTIVRSAYGYAVDIPSAHLSGDCRTVYTVIKAGESLTIFVDSKQQGSGEVVHIAVTQDAILESRLAVSFELLVKHYHMQRDCRRCLRRCSYSWSETITEKLDVSDSILVYHYPDFPFAELHPLYRHWGTTTAMLKTKDNTEITFPSSSLSEYHTAYDAFFYLKPYDFAQVRAQSFNYTRINNLLYSNKTVAVKESNPCIITAWNHFYKTSHTCDLSKVKDLVFTSPIKSSVLFAIVIIMLLLASYSAYLLLHRR